MAQEVSTAISIRPFETDDESDVLALLGAALGGGPTGRRDPGFFRWKHFENPFGPSFMLVAEAGGTIVGLRAFMRWQFMSGDRPVQAVRAVDTATHPSHQGKGIFSMLTRAAVEDLRQDVDLIFNTPNEKSAPGYLKMGWRTLGKIPVSVRVRRPIRFFKGITSLRSGSENLDARLVRVDAETAGNALLDEEGVERLLDQRTHQERLTTPLSLPYLRWRFALGPLDYRAVSERRGGRLSGMAIFRVRSRGRLAEATVSAVLGPDGGSALRRVARSADVDHVTCHFSSRSAARRAAAIGFVPSKTGITLVVNPLREGVSPDPTKAGSWALSLGDLEVF